MLNKSRPHSISLLIIETGCQNKSYYKLKLHLEANGLSKRAKTFFITHKHAVRPPI